MNIKSITTIGLILITIVTLSGCVQDVEPVTANTAPTIAPTTQPVHELKTLQFNGTGKSITDEFYLERGIAKTDVATNGQGFFAVWLIDNQGNKIELLANTNVKDKTWDGQQAVRIERSGYYLLDVTSTGNWAAVIKN